MREKLIELLSAVQSYGIKYTYEETASSMGFRDNTEVADHLIANGVTIPVRCKECRFWHKDTVSCDFVTADTNWYEEDFCSYGERRTDG